MSDETRIALPVVPLVGTVLYPGLILPLSIGRPRSVQAGLSSWESASKMIVIFSQRHSEVADPGPADLCEVGVRALVRSMTQRGASLELVVQGVDRVRSAEFIQTEPFMAVRAESLLLSTSDACEVEALDRMVSEQAAIASSLAALGRQEYFNNILSVERSQRAYYLANFFNLPPDSQQQLLEADDEMGLLKLLHGFLIHEVAVLEVRQKIAARSTEDTSHIEKEQILRQQLVSIHKELGDDCDSPEVSGLRLRMEKVALTEFVKEEAGRQLHHLEGLPTISSEYQVIRSHLELILELPWVEATADRLDLAHARQVLNRDHHGLERVKERILEYLAVMNLNPSAHAPILCFVGPPGTGKTSLGKSIAAAIERKFERMSLGGMHDEAELRGHRCTYVGAMAGRIIQALRRAKVRNPLLMLDEVDKLCHDSQGDPASALLEILDPAQNREFHDNYLDIPFDLSQVFFIATANGLDSIPSPLLDRMEIIRLSGYTALEKLEIARDFIIPRQLGEAGLSADSVEVPDETIAHLITHYTREAGVRGLERTLARLFRRLALGWAEGGVAPGRVTIQSAEELLGPEDFLVETARTSLEPGVSTGMAWTESGGDILYLEVALLPEGGELILTGNLGEVMKESARTARSYVLSRALRLGLDAERARQSTHIHVPAGATPKDGPSAGLAMVCALVSAVAGLAVRADTAMSGEITLSGLVLPVGGLKEKIMAAQRAGIRRVLLPRLNEHSLSELPPSVRSEIEVVFVDHIEEAIHYAIPGLQAQLPEAIRLGTAQGRWVIPQSESLSPGRASVGGPRRAASRS